MSATKKILVDQSLGGVARIKDVPTPIDPGDAISKDYADSLLKGLTWKSNVRVASTGNVNLTSAPASIDGITLATGDRVLIKDQSTVSENGLYVFNGSGSAMTRSDDAATFEDLEAAVVTVEEGTANAGVTYRQSQVNGTVGVDDIIWEPFIPAAASASETVAGVIEIATQAEVDAGTDTTRAVTPATLANWSGRTLKYNQLFGTTVDTQYTITHNLGTEDIHVTVYDAATKEEVEVYTRVIDGNNLEVCVAAAPGTNALKVVIHG